MTNPCRNSSTAAFRRVPSARANRGFGVPPAHAGGPNDAALWRGMPEPSLSEIFADPIIAALMRADGQCRRDVETALAAIARRPGG
jgi:hypothetical protein